MLITLQFPLFDTRYILADPNRTEKPEWPTPQQREKVRYFGEIIDRKEKYLGPWDDEKKFCTAHSVINLCGTGKNNFYKALHQSPSQSRILFRRFQSDGKCLSKFEIGFNDNFENTLDKATLENGNLKEIIFTHLKGYLLCPVKIRIGNKLSDFIPLIDAGRYLKHSFFWASTKGKKSFDPKEMKNKVESCEPVLLVQLNSTVISFTEAELSKIKMPNLKNENIRLSLGYIPYKIDRYNYNLKSWIICLPRNISTNPILKNEFHYYNTTLRYLRINLLRIHIEVIVQKKFLAYITRLQNGQPVQDQQSIIRIYTYLHKLFLNLSNIQRNKQPQEELVNAAFRIDETYANSDSIEDLMNSAKFFMIWLKTLPLTPQTTQVISYLDKLIEEFDIKITDGKKENTVFISYNHNDTIVVNLLKNKLEGQQIKVILDSTSMKAGTDIENFIGESISNSNATISVISDNSLLSGWVAMETVNIINFETLFKNKKFIPCCIDENFTKDSFVTDASIKFDDRLNELSLLIQQQDKNKIDSRNFNDEKSRILFLKNNLDGIIGKLKKKLYINIEGNNLDSNFKKILSAIED